jgi:hypothetical protein
MTIYWHELTFTCTECHRDIALQKIFAAGNGYIDVQGVCPACHETRTISTSVASIMRYCLEDDVLHPIEEGMEHRDPLVVREVAGGRTAR